MPALLALILLLLLLGSDRARRGGYLACPVLLDDAFRFSLYISCTLVIDDRIKIRNNRPISCRIGCALRLGWSTKRSPVRRSSISIGSSRSPCPPLDFILSDIQLFIHLITRHTNPWPRSTTWSVICMRTILRTEAKVLRYPPP